MRRDDDLVRWCGSWGAGLLILTVIGAIVLGVLAYLGDRAVNPWPGVAR